MTHLRNDVSSRGNRISANLTANSYCSNTTAYRSLTLCGSQSKDKYPESTSFFLPPALIESPGKRLVDLLARAGAFCDLCCSPSSKMSDVTVESLLEQCDLTESDLNSWIERVHFLEISRCLKEWRLLALKLPELNEGVVADIETDNHREQDRRLKFLEQLKQKLAINATYGLLVRKLVEIGKRDDAHSLCRHLKGKFCYWLMHCVELIN